jgi:hypothetical protein
MDVLEITAWRHAIAASSGARVRAAADREARRKPGASSPRR